MTENIMSVKPYPLGAHYENGKIRFSFVSEKENCGVIIYDRYTGKKIKKIPFSKEDKIGNIYYKYVDNICVGEFSYHFFEGNKIIVDERAKAFDRKFAYGKARREKDMKAVIPVSDFEWEGDRNPRIPYENCMVYCMHVRGFTKHASSGVEDKGTFKGVTEKIAYLKETGITTIELQPAYDFYEMSYQEGEKKLNYWGYQKGFYYTPKASYAAGMDAQTEFKDMVKELHKNKIEIVMQFYFPKEISLLEILEILRFWVMEYHVDGFHLIGEKIAADLIAGDAALAYTKLWYQSFDTNVIYNHKESPKYVNLAEYKDDYLYTMRHFLKGDEDMLGSVMYQMRHIPSQSGRIHYMSNYFGMTLKDMVSYDYKHNEGNGENNKDGNDYNHSWNCGEEGKSRKKKVLELRLRQIKNAMCMLIFTQSTPLIFMGDEFGNSQQGNNNPYCQDNSTTWLNWKDLEKNQEIYKFWKKLVALRKNHPVLRPDSEYRIMDYISCGYPDLSYHGENVWRPQLENYFRHIGMMYCGKYAKINSMTEDDFFYVAINMHWESHMMALPKIPANIKWRMVCTTTEEKEIKEVMQEEKFYAMIPARSIVIYKSEANE